MAIMQMRKLMGLETEPAQVWPPTDEMARLSRYRRYRRLFDGDHEAVFGRERNTPTYIAANLARNIVTVVSDLLFGEDFEVQGAAGEPLPDVVAEILVRNRLVALMHESSLDAAYYGDGVFIVSRGEDGLAYVDSQNPEMWFPVADPDDQRNVLAHKFAWERELDGKTFLRITIHEPGVVREECWLTEKGEIKRPATDGEWQALYPNGRPLEQVETGVDELLVVHAPNFRAGKDYYGISEYQGVESLFDALNARLTQMDRILTRHSDPMLGLPADTFKSLRSQDSPVPPQFGGRGGGGGVGHRIDKRKLDVYMMGENGEKAEYATWDGQLATNLAFVDLLVRQIASVTETAPQLLGIEQIGGAMSGRALRILLIRTLAKVGRRRRYYEHAIKDVLRLCQMVEGVEPVDLEIKWPDGLPQDQTEDNEIMNLRLSNGTIDHVTAIQRLDGVDEESAQAMYDKVVSDGDAERNNPALARSMESAQGASAIQVQVGDMTRV